MPGHAGILRKGWDGYRSRALSCDILVEHDGEIHLRDGARFYADIHRSPETSSSPWGSGTAWFQPFWEEVQWFVDAEHDDTMECRSSRWPFEWSREV
jgi:hypothetical protein